MVVATALSPHRVGAESDGFQPAPITHSTGAPRVPKVELINPPHVQVATSREQLLAAYRLVYRRYADRGLVERQPGGIIYSPEFAYGDSRTLVALGDNGEVGATATIVGTPAQHDSFADAVIPWQTIRATSGDRRYAGVTCLASVDCERGIKPTAFFAVARFLFQYAQYRGYDGLVISIHPRHFAFYERICPIVPIGPAYRQPKLGNALAIACRIDLDGMALTRVAPSVLSWFAQPISMFELNKPGVSAADNAFFLHYANTCGTSNPVSRVA